MPGWLTADMAAGRQPPASRFVQMEWPEKSYWVFTCPFCSEQVQVSKGALRSLGKRCTCGAMFGPGGIAYPQKSPHPRMTGPELKAALVYLFGRKWRRMASRQAPDGLGIAVSSINRYTRAEDPWPVPGPVEAAVVAWKRLEDRLRAERARSTRRRAKGGDGD